LEKIQLKVIIFTLYRTYPLTAGRMMTFGKFCIFIDGANLHYTLKNLQLYLDYRRLLTYFRTQGTLVRAYYLTALLDYPDTPEWLVRLIDWLEYNNFTVITKRAQRFTRYLPTGDDYLPVTEVKGNINVELAVEAFYASRYCDTIVIVSGNGELVPLVTYLQKRGCQVVVVSSAQTSDTTIATDLVRQADMFLDLATLRPHIQMAERVVPASARPDTEAEVGVGEGQEVAAEEEEATGKGFLVWDDAETDIPAGDTPD
jgi:uncharacterized LabA/DUF88 family protein